MKVQSEQFADAVIIAIGNNHCWGKGNTLEDALKNASRPQKWVAYICHADTTVSEMDGSLTWTRGHAPRVIASRGVKTSGQLLSEGLTQHNADGTRTPLNGADDAA